MPSQGNSDLDLQAAPPLNSLSTSTQECVLIRDLLSVLSGMDGQYIRVALGGGGVAHGGAGHTNTSSSSGKTRVASSTGANADAPKLADASLIIDTDTADRSTASQVHLLHVAARDQLGRC